MLPSKRQTLRITVVCAWSFCENHYHFNITEGLFRDSLTHFSFILILVHSSPLHCEAKGELNKNSKALPTVFFGVSREGIKRASK